MSTCHVLTRRSASDMARLLVRRVAGQGGAVFGNSLVAGGGLAGSSWATRGGGGRSAVVAFQGMGGPRRRDVGGRAALLALQLGEDFSIDLSSQGAISSAARWGRRSASAYDAHECCSPRTTWPLG